MKTASPVIVIRPRALAAVSILVCLAAFSERVDAGGEWFNSRTVKGQSEPVARFATRRGNTQAATVIPQSITFTETGLPVNIPDPGGITVDLPVNQAGTAAGMTISYHITHPFVGDLAVNLIAPSGKSFPLRNGEGGSSDNIDVVSSSVAGSGGETAAGTWRLGVADNASGDSGTLDSWSLSFPVAGSADIDLVVSLSANPQGDDDGNHQGQANSADQDKWERIMQYFADGVYEATNAAHKIRNIRIFRNGHAAGTADVVWTHIGHPAVPSKGGVGEKGGHINMYEIFKDGEGAGVDHDMLADEIGSGYTQAHEWGHYFYGVYDEYHINDTDVAVVPSIMNSQWMAEAGDNKWLNYSIKNDGGGDFQDTLHTRQHDQHGASAWETLSRTTNKDIKTAADLSLGQRIYYPEVAAAAPAPGATPRTDLPGSARSDLNIMWMSDEDVYEIVIDHSGSMGDENKMEQAKAAAQLLLDVLPLGKSRVGVIEFDSSVDEIQAIIPLTTQADKNDVKAKIAAIDPAGGTAIGDAAQQGLATILATKLDKTNRVVFLLSDGQSNEGSDPLSVIPAYQNAQIPLFTFAFGSDADGATLQTMAQGTRGKFYSSPASLAVITTAFQDAQSIAAFSPSLAAGSMSLGNGENSSSFIVDSTVGQLNFSLTHGPNVDSSQVQLMSPSGAAISPVDSITVGSETLLSFIVPNPQKGVWHAQTQNTGNSGDVTFTASAVTDSLTYSTTVESAGGENITYPAPIILRAKLFKHLHITQANVTAEAIAPDGSKQTLQLQDDGANGDGAAGDGIYAAVLRYTQNGTYTFKVNFDNSNNTALETYHGATFSATTNGTAPPDIADRPLGETFTRSSQIQVTTSGGTFTRGGIANVSTRLSVQTNDNVLIGGFIVTGSQPKTVIVRAIGPSLPVAGALQDPTLELHDLSGATIASNDDWGNSPNTNDIINSGVAPTDSHESAILMSLQPGSYTAIVRGYQDSTGIGLVEVYDLSPNADSKLANISTRGLVQTGDDVLIGGLIITGDAPQSVLVRAIGPSLPVASALADPTLELHDGNGVVIGSNDDWRSDQEAAIQATTIPPQNDAESAIVTSLAPGGYTAIVRGKSNSTGVGLVEVYNLQ